MHPMVGTEEGGSGWYQAKAEVFYFHVDEHTGEWTKLQGPMTEREWRHGRAKADRSREQLAAQEQQVLESTGGASEMQEESAGKEQKVEPDAIQREDQKEKEELDGLRSVSGGISAVTV